jgi:inorganic phosphate transporter, PiT family
MGNAFIILVLVVILALAFDYINGFHDTANAVATVVSTGVLPGRTAVILAAVCNFVGAFVGVGVAKTIGGEIASPTSITQLVVAAALLGASAWNLLTWYFGIPSSSSHALIGGVVGAVWCYRVLAGEPAGKAIWELLNSNGVLLTLKALVLSPICGLFGGLVLMILLYWIASQLNPATANRSFRVLQLGSASFMAFSHGSNDAQKTMGVITLALVAYASQEGQATSDDLKIPLWVIMACATAMGLGTASGGWRIMKTMGQRIIKLQPINGFAAETAASIVILLATWLKAPVSTTHIISSSIMGVGASKRFSAVRWGVAQNMLIAWVLTLPISAVVSACVYFLFHAFLV